MRRNAKFGAIALATVLTAILSCGSAYAATGTYTVQSGDTLWLLSQRFNFSLASIEQANPGVNPNDLLIGQVLALPGQAASGGALPGQAASGGALPGQAASGGNPAVSSNNLLWMERIIAAEAQGQPVGAKLAVGAVVMNRLHAGYGPSVQSVIFQRINGIAQFTSVANGWIYRVQPSASDMAIASQVLSGTDILPAALVFYNPAQTPAGSWVRRQPVLASYGSLTFAS